MLILVIIVAIVLIIILVNPFGIFTGISADVKFWALFIFFIALQVALIYGYIRVAFYINKVYRLYKNKLLRYAFEIKSKFAPY